jgi:CBS domain-containing protein
MSVTRLMTHDPEHCAPETDLAAAAMIMWRSDCGMVPVVEPESNRLVGVITDRDICMAAATKHQPACCIPVGDVMARTVTSCRPSDSVGKALARMAEHRVRRVPVVDDEGTLVGVLSVADLIRAAGSPGREHSEPVTAGAVLSAMRSICQPADSRAESSPARAAGGRRSKAPVETPAGHV